MKAKEKILSQRERFILWTPILALLLVIAMDYAPFYEIKFSETDFEMSDNESTTTTEFYDDYMSEYSSSEDRYNSNLSSDWFGGETQRIVEADSTPDDEDYLGQMMVDIDSELSTWLLISTILFLLIIIGIKDRIQVNKFINHEMITGALLAFMAFSSLLLVFSIIGYGSDFSDEAFGDIDDDGADEFEYDDGFWGGVYAESENDDGVSQYSEITWGPDLGFLALIFFSIFTLLGAIACFVTKFEELDVEQAPRWLLSDDPPEFFTKHLDKLPSILIATTVLLAIGSAFTPWYSIEQTWEGTHLGDNKSQTTHDFAWTMSPFVVAFDNQSGLDEISEGETSTSYNSYSEHPELENIAEPMLELRWPLICILLLCLIVVTKKVSSRVSNAIKGEEKGWNTLFLAAIVISISLTNSAFEDGIFRKAEDDIDDLSASYSLKPIFTEAKDTNFGQDYTTFVNGSWWSGDDLSIYTIQVSWGNSIGATLSSLAAMIGLFALLLIWSPLIIRQVNEAKIPTFNSEQVEPWKGRPAIAMMIAVVLITSLGGGVGELVLSSESSAPEGLYKWRFDWDENTAEVEDSATLKDGESMSLSIDTSEVVPGNATLVQIVIYCDEGETEVGDRRDNIDWTISAPEGVDTSQFETSGDLQCFNNEDYITIFAEWTYPDGEQWAQNGDEILSQFKWNRTLTGTWEVTVTAEVLGAGHPFESDENLYVECDIYVLSMDGIHVEIDEE